MATFRVRRLYCIFCCETFRTRVPIIRDMEMPTRCNECDQPLFNLGYAPARPESATPGTVHEAIEQAEAWCDPSDDELP